MVLQDGAIVGQGDHPQLTAAGGAHARLRGAPSDRMGVAAP
ncbi:hypothetical protein [Kitasatospora acidiphila]